LVPDTSISGTRVARELDRLLVACGKPKTYIADWLRHGALLVWVLLASLLRTS
jgi:putative transposase